MKHARNNRQSFGTSCTTAHTAAYQHQLLNSTNTHSNSLSSKAPHTPSLHTTTNLHHSQQRSSSSPIAVKNIQNTIPAQFSCVDSHARCGTPASLRQGAFLAALFAPVRRVFVKRQVGLARGAPVFAHTPISYMSHMLGCVDVWN